MREIQIKLTYMINNMLILYGSIYLGIVYKSADIGHLDEKR